MTHLPPRGDTPPRTVGGLAQVLSHRLQETYRLNQPLAGRVEAALIRNARNRQNERVGEASPLGNHDPSNPTIHFLPNVAEALKAGIPPEAIVQLFDGSPEELDVLGEREYFTLGLARDLREGQPFYSLSGLKDLLDSFQVFLEENEQQLLETGCPRTRFVRSPFLFDSLAPLYPVKHPVRILRREDSESLEYLWENGGSIEDHPLVGELNPEDAEKLARERKSFFDLKMLVTRTLAKAVGSGSAEVDVWGNAFELMKRELSKERAHFLFDMDSALTGVDIRDNRVGDRPSLPTGGLSNLIGLVGHVHDELTVGLCAGTINALGELVTQDDNGRQRLAVDSYYEAISQDRHEAIDSAYDHILSRRYRLQESSAKYLSRVRLDLVREFGVQFKRSMICDLPMPGTTLPALERNVFRRMGDYWRIVYAGKEILLKDLHSPRYIWILMRYQGQDVPCIKLIQDAQGTVIPHSDSGVKSRKESLRQQTIEEYGKMNTKQLEEEGLHRLPSWGRKPLQAVSKAINRVLNAKNIKDDHPQLLQHLKDAVRPRGGEKWSYRPSEDPRWDLGS